MATSKTLTPTNVTIQIPAFTDQPDQRVNSNCIDKEADAINALNSKIENKIKTITDNFTTDAYGNTGVFASSKNVLAAYADSVICVPFWFNNYTYLYITDLSHNTKANSTLSITIIYTE